MKADLELNTKAGKQASVERPKGKKAQARVTHASAVRMAIESDIFMGNLLPGTPIDEDELAERFNVSRTPVREAMLQLLQSGLIEKLPRRPAMVARLDLPRLIHMYETVSELEALCARYAATRMTTRERDALVKVHELSEQALQAGDIAEVGRHGRKFHSLIIESTHNSVLIETTTKLALHTLAYRRFQLSRPGFSEQNQHFHAAILEAILAGDNSEAFEQMRRHVTVQGDVLADYISMGEDNVDLSSDL